MGTRRPGRSPGTLGGTASPWRAGGVSSMAAPVEEGEKIHKVLAAAGVASRQGKKKRKKKEKKKIKNKMRNKIV
jgi:hypothetical protein